MTSFDGLGLNEAITRAIAEEKVRRSSAIQGQTIPIATSRRDIIGIAQTGIGKIAAFPLPIWYHLVTDEGPADTTQSLAPDGDAQCSPSLRMRMALSHTTLRQDHADIRIQV